MKKYPLWIERSVLLTLLAMTAFAVGKAGTIFASIATGCGGVLVSLVITEAIGRRIYSNSAAPNGIHFLEESKDTLPRNNEAEKCSGCEEEEG